MNSFVKLVPGFVRQSFETGPDGKFRCVGQEFVLEDGICLYENAQEQSIDPPEYEYCPYDMIVDMGKTVRSAIAAAKYMVIREQAVDENERHSKPCPHTPGIKCVQMPEEDCDCNYCMECINGPKLK